MFYRSKYIIIELGMYTAPFVFSELSAHRDVAQALSYSEPDVLGAGFCHIADGKYVCYGESTSLGVKSRGEEDAKFLNKYLGVTGD